MYDVYTRRRETSLFSFVFSLSLAVLQTAEPKRECREISAMRRVFLLLLASRLLIIFSQSVPKEWARYETTVGAKSATGAVPCRAGRCVSSRHDAVWMLRIQSEYSYGTVGHTKLSASTVSVSDGSERERGVSPLTKGSKVKIASHRKHALDVPPVICWKNLE